MASSRVLLVDDNEQNRYILARSLSRAGLVVEECVSGKAALQAVLKQPDVVILDVKLPDISGYEVCRRIKSNPLTAHVPVLQISATFVSSESRVMALEVGADSYLTHPIDPTVLLATVRALLRLRRAETLSRQSAEQWQATFDALAEGLVLLDAENRIVRCNRCLASMSGAASEELIGQSGEVVLKKIVGTADFLQNRGLARYTTECHHEWRWFQVTVDPVISSGQRSGSIVVLADVTERKLAEQTLRNSEKLAATGRMAHVIAHEINNPLQALTSLIYLSTKLAINPEVRNYLTQATEELSRISRITKQVLSFNRDTNREVPLDLNELLESVIALYGTQIEARSLHLAYKKTPVPKVDGFPGELRQVLANLLGNAIDASPDHATISVRLRPLVKNGVQGVRLTICDSGHGIPKDLQRQVFEPFFTTKELKGSGLGLWLSTTIVTKHQGSLRLWSSTTPNRSGTCVSLFLPAVTEAARNTVAS